MTSSVVVIFHFYNSICPVSRLGLLITNVIIVVYSYILLSYVEGRTWRFMAIKFSIRTYFKKLLYATVTTLYSGYSVDTISVGSGRAMKDISMRWLLMRSPAQKPSALLQGAESVLTCGSVYTLFKWQRSSSFSSPIVSPFFFGCFILCGTMRIDTQTRD